MTMVIKARCEFHPMQNKSRLGMVSFVLAITALAGFTFGLLFRPIIEFPTAQDIHHLKVFDSVIISSMFVGTSAFILGAAALNARGGTKLFAMAGVIIGSIFFIINMAWLYRILF